MKQVAVAPRPDTSLPWNSVTTALTLGNSAN
jgi:hypothetical protein